MGNTKNVTGDANRDPISDAPGSHPVGTGVGAVVGGVAAGAAAGTIAGPVGTAVGAAAGAIAGGLAGKEIGEVLDPTVEDTYWRTTYKRRSYVGPDGSYEDFGPAYGYGVSAFQRYPDRSFDELDSELARDWEAARRGSQLDWERARPAARDAWDRLRDAMERGVPGYGTGGRL